MTPLQAIDFLVNRTGDESPWRIAVAANVAGKADDSALVRLVVRDLLDHEVPMVRRAAILALAEHVNDELHDRLVVFAKREQNADVRRAALYVISGGRMPSTNRPPALK